MDWLLTVELDERIIEKIDRTAKRLRKTRIEVASVIIEHILENLKENNFNNNIAKQISCFDNNESWTSY